MLEDRATAETAQTLRDEMLYHRATQTCLWAPPLINTLGMQRGSEKAFGAGYHVLPVHVIGFTDGDGVRLTGGDELHAEHAEGRAGRELLVRDVVRSGERVGPRERPAVAVTRIATTRSPTPMAAPTSTWGRRLGRARRRTGSPRCPAELVRHSAALRADRSGAHQGLETWRLRRDEVTSGGHHTGSSSTWARTTTIISSRRKSACASPWHGSRRTCGHRGTLHG